MPDFLKLPFNATINLPPGMIAAVVTSLEMRAPPPRKADPDVSGQFALVRLNGSHVERYLAMYRTLGHRWMWFSRLLLPRASIVAILDDPQVAAYCLVREGQDIGLLELDFRIAGECELAFFGLVEAAIGKGAGRWMINRALQLAWAGPVARLWVHTCSFDHPGAPDFYRSSGFRVFRTGIEIADDPRLSGHLPRDAAPHVPILEN